MTEKPENVRFARRGDEEPLMRMFRAMHAENGQGSLCEDKVAAVIRSAIDGAAVGARMHCTVGVIEGEEGEIAGSIGMGLAQWWYSEDWHVEEMWNYVACDYRRVPGPSNAQTLIQFGKWFAEQMSIPFLIGVVSTLRTDAKIRFYERQKLPKVGAFFLYNNCEGV